MPAGYIGREVQWAVGNVYQFDPRTRSGLEVKDRESLLFMIETIGLINLFREGRPWGQVGAEKCEEIRTWKQQMSAPLFRSLIVKREYLVDFRRRKINQVCFSLLVLYKGDFRISKGSLDWKPCVTRYFWKPSSYHTHCFHPRMFTRKTPDS